MPAHVVQESELDDFELQREASRQLAAPALPGFEVIAYIGAGTFGDVWKARQQETGALVAIKRLRKQPDQQSRSEVRMLAGLDAARGIVALKNIHLDSEPFAYVMEYMPGGTLADLIAQREKLPFREAWRIYHELTEALAYVHRHGIVHCDIKPENVLLDARGKPRLSDFGQSRGQGPRGSSLGTRFYMPPEQARLEPPDARWDVYALGAILFQMLTGKKPRYDSRLATELSAVSHSGSEMRDRLEKYSEHLERHSLALDYRALPGVTPEVIELLQRCLATDIATRPKDATEVLALVQRSERQRRRRPLLVLGGVAPALTLLVAGLVVIFGGIMALREFQDRWIAQVVNDNQALAKTIATELESRFNERIRVIRHEAEDAGWPALLKSKGQDTPARLKEKLERLYETYTGHRFRRWAVADGDGFSVLTYGMMPSGHVEMDETNRGRNFAWRGWFNGVEDIPVAQAEKDEPDVAKKAREFLAARRSERGHVVFLTQPYRRQSGDPKKQQWTIGLSCVVPPAGEGPPAGVLAGQMEYREFNGSFARFESSKSFERRIIVANERGQILYHLRLATQVKNDDPAAEVRHIDLASKQNAFFAHSLAPASGNVAETTPAASSLLPVAYKDPWYADQDSMEYYFSAATATLLNGQKLGVFVLHDRQTALAGFTDAEQNARWLGFSLLGIGCAFLIGNIAILRSTLQREESDDA
jgi:hypothetical protein